MRTIFAIVKKELRSIFSNKTIIAQIILIPFFYIFGFSMLMTSMNPEDSDNKGKPENTFNGYYINAPEFLLESLKSIGLEEKSITDIEILKEEIKKEDCDIIVSFPNNFLTEENISNVEIWYDSSLEKSYKAFFTVNSMLDTLRPQLFTINIDKDNQYDLVNEDKAIREILALVFPTYTLIAIILASQALAAETIAGDKERGFLNMILLTPTKRYNIALGKSISMIIVNIISAISAFVAVAISLPKFSEVMSSNVVVSFKVIDYLNFLLLTITGTTILISLMLLISTLAKSVKQASASSGVIMMIVLLLTMLTSSGNDMTETINSFGITNAYIPVWNSIYGMQNIFKGTLDMSMMPIICIINIITILFILGIIAKLFNSEKIVNNTNN